MKLSDNVVKLMKRHSKRNAGIVCVSFALMAIASIAGAIWGHFTKEATPQGVCTSRDNPANSIPREPCPGCGMG